MSVPRYAACLFAGLALGCATPESVHVEAPLLAGREIAPDDCRSGEIQALVDNERSDPKRAARVLRAQCNHGNAQACLLLGELTLAGCGVPRNVDTAKRWFAHGCRGGDATSCGEHALLASKSRPADERMAKELLAACDGGHARACTVLGDRLGTGELPGDAKLSLDLFERGCSLGDADGCHQAGLLYARGDGMVPANRNRAQELLGRACSGRIDASCRALGEALLASPEKVPRPH